MMAVKSRPASDGRTARSSLIGEQGEQATQIESLLYDWLSFFAHSDWTALQEEFASSADLASADLTGADYHNRSEEVV